MFIHIFEIRVQYKNVILDKTGLIIWSQILEIMTEKEPLKTLKNIAKKYQKK